MQPDTLLKRTANGVRPSARSSRAAAHDSNGCPQGMVADAAVCEGRMVTAEIERCFSRDPFAYLPLHNAKQGCSSCHVDAA